MGGYWSARWVAEWAYPRTFVPDTWVDISATLGVKLAAMACYESELRPYPHPRSLQALEPYDAWFTGVRKEETDARSDTRVVHWDARREMVKVNPIVDWTQEQVDAYIAEHGILVNPLVYDGYPSIGCATCTVRVEAGGDARSGRCAGTGKTECGIHL